MKRQFEISEEMDALVHWHSEQWKIENERIEQKRSDLRKECGIIGHFFKMQTSVYGAGKACVFCGAREKD